MKIDTPLLPHQKEAVKKLKKIKIGALYMEQGTGKTRTALELISMRLSSAKVDAALWLCPCSVKKNLREDLAYYCGEFPQDVVVRGIESLSSADLLYMKLLELVKKYKVFLVVDESNLTKNKDAIRTQRVIELASHCEYKLILNGTPISKNEADMFTQWYILDWRILGYQSFYSFSANHLEYKRVRLPNGREIVDYNHIERVLNTDYLSEKIAPYTYQVKKAECLKLPDKKYFGEPFALDEAQVEEYERVKMTYLEYVDEIRSETIYKLFAALQHVVSGRRVLTSPTERMETAVMVTDEENPRLLALRRILERRIGDEKVLIFCKYRTEATSICKMLTRMGKSSVLFTGEISQRKRQENRKRFRDDVQVMVANKACGAYGLNLQFCRNIIFYSNDFDLATRMQAEDRVHRIGQTEEVRIYDIYSVDTIDEFIMRCLWRKESLVEEFKKNIEKWRDEMIKYRQISSGIMPEEFYIKLGPFLGARDVRKEFDGYPLSNADDWTWIVAEDGDEIVGFVSIEPKNKVLQFSAGYVIPSHRRKGVYKRLIKEAVKFAGNRAMDVTTREYLVPLFEKAGFQALKMKGKKWRHMRRVVGEENIS